jgi:steroid Delta-isomerase
MNQLNSIVKYFEQLSPQLLVLIGGVYTDNAYFKDPFVEVRGATQIKDIYLRRFQTYREPALRVRQQFSGSDGAALLWDLTFSQQGERKSISGMTHLRLSDDGRIQHQRDYWDAAEAVYEKIPGLGAVLRYAKRKVNTLSIAA